MAVARASIGEWLVAASIGAALTAVLTYPTLPGLMSQGRIDTGDGRFSIWNVGWIGHALLTDASVFDANIFHPHSGTLAYSELNLVAGLLGLPVFAATGSAIAALNSAVLVGLFLTFMVTWALVRRLTGSADGALGAATALTFCPFVQAHTAHIQLLMTFGIPLVLVGFHAFRERLSPWLAIALGVALAVAGLACGYYGIFAGGALGTLAVFFARAERRYWVGLGIAAVVTAALVVPIFVPYLESREAVRPASGVNLVELREYSASWAAYTSSPAFLHESLPWHRAAPESVFPGFLLLGFAAAGVATVIVSGSGRDRHVVLAYLALGGLAFWASFGPDWGLYSAMMRIVPAMDMLRAPVRLGIVVALALAVLAGFGLRAMAARNRWLAFAAVPVFAMEVATLPWPLVEAPPVPAAYRRLAALPPGAVVEFPFMYRRTDYLNHTRYMFNSTYHWKPIVNGYSDVTPPDFSEIAAPINAFPDESSFAIMKRLNVRYITWNFGPRGYDPVSRDKIVARIPPYSSHLRPLVTTGDVWLYEIVSWP